MEGFLQLGGFLLSHRRLLVKFVDHPRLAPCRNGGAMKLDAGWPESEEEQVGNVKLEEEVTRRIRIDRQEERQTYLDR